MSAEPPRRSGRASADAAALRMRSYFTPSGAPAAVSLTSAEPAAPKPGHPFFQPKSADAPAAPPANAAPIEISDAPVPSASPPAAQLDAKRVHPMFMTLQQRLEKQHANLKQSIDQSRQWDSDARSGRELHPFLQPRALPAQTNKPSLSSSSSLHPVADIPAPLPSCLNVHVGGSAPESRTQPILPARSSSPLKMFPATPFSLCDLSTPSSEPLPRANDADVPLDAALAALEYRFSAIATSPACKRVRIICHIQIERKTNFITSAFIDSSRHRPAPIT